MRYPNSPLGGVPAKFVAGVFGDAATLTIASGVLAKVTNSKNLLVAGQGGAADDLTSITGYSDGDLLLLRPASGSVTITVKDNADLNLSGSDFVMDDEYDSMILLNVGSNKWVELSRSAN